MAFLLYAIIGLISGFFSGLLGIGGGIIIVPCLLLIFPLLGLPISAHLAIGSSLATIIFTLISSVRTQLKTADKPLLMRLARQFLPGIIIGTFIGVYIANRLSSEYLTILFGLIVWALALRVFFVNQKSIDTDSRNIMDRLPSKFNLTFINILIASLAVIMGIGGGGFTIIFLQLRKIPMHVSIAIAALMGIPVAMLGTLTYIFLGYHDPILPTWSTGYVYWPAVLGITITSMFTAPLGAKVAARSSERTLRKIFVVLLIAIGAKMIF